LEYWGLFGAYFTEIQYAAKSWDKERRVIAKLGYMSQGANPRFVVTEPVVTTGGQISFAYYFLPWLIFFWKTYTD